jgi:hypothetical protein
MTSTSLIWEPPLDGESAPGTDDYLAIVKIPGEARGFSAKVFGSGSRWHWSVWRHARTSVEESAGLKMGQARSKLEAAARATEALDTMRRHFGL